MNASIRTASLQKAGRVDAAVVEDVSSNSVTPFNRRRLLPIGGWEAALLLLLVAVIAGFGMKVPGFLDSTSGLLALTENFLPFGLVALGLSLVIFTGGIDLSVGATASLAAVVAAQIWSAWGVNIWLAAGKLGTPYVFRRLEKGAPWARWIRKMHDIEQKDPAAVWETKPGPLCSYCPVKVCRFYRGG